MCIDGHFACMYEVANGCELPCGFWELNPAPLEELSVLLTAEPSLQPPKFYPYPWP